MKKLTLTLCLLAAIGSLMAGPIDQQKAQKVGTRFLSTTVLSQKNANIQLDLVSVAADRDVTDYYVFNVSNGEGFVVIAGDDRVRPILAYSTTGKYNPSDVADGFQYTLNGYREEIHYIREHNLAATPDIVAEWKRVSETGSLNRGGQTRAVVGPLCQTLWRPCVCRLRGHCRRPSDEILGMACHRNRLAYLHPRRLRATKCQFW